MRRLPWFVVPALLLAGCVVERDPAAPAALASAPTPEPQGDVETPAPGEDAPPVQPPAPALPRVEPLAYEGRTPRWACVPDGPASCTGHGLGAEGENVVLVVPHAGVVRVEGALSWTARTPATAELTLSLAAARPCGEACLEWSTLVARAGPSPLALAEDVDLPAGAALALIVEHAAPQPTPLAAEASLDQAFAFEGAVTLR